MADRVPEVEHLTAASVALVFGYDSQLRARTGEDRALVKRRVCGDALPQLAAGDQGGLQHLDIAGRKLRRRERRACRVDDHPAGWW